MLRQSALFATVVALASSAAAGPLRRQSTVLSGGAVPVFAMGSSSFDPSSSTLSSFGSSQSFDNWGGISSLSGFDNFYGSDNFCGQQNSIHMSGESLVCQSASINYVQQQYAVIAEYAKKVLLSSVCEVESQAIVWGQFMGMMQSFQNDFMHLSESRPPTFDSNVAGQINSLCSESGDINLGDLGISGSSIGSSCVSVSGLNWNPQTSPESCGQAWSDCQSVISSSLSAPICGSSTSVSSSCTEIHEPPVVVSSGSSDCESSDCGSSISLPPSSSDCSSESDCGSSSISSGSDCDSSSSSDCGSSIISSMPSMDCGSSDCSSITAGNDSSVDNSTLSDGGDDGADATDSAGDATPLPTDLPSADNSTSTDSSDASATGSDGAVAALPTDDGSDDSSASATDSAGDAAPTDSSDASASSTDSTDDSASTDSSDASASSTDSAADASSTGSGVVAL